jgi:hypothetical protein
MLVPTRVESFITLSSGGRLLAMPTNIKLGWQCQTLAYNSAELVMAMKSLLIEATCYKG